MVTDDQSLTYRVERAIGQLPGVDMRNFRISADKGRVRLVGVVATLAEKEAAIGAARGVEGVREVEEAVSVEAPFPPTDQVLSQELDVALDEEEAVDARAVGADAAGGQARLVGTAGSLAEWGQAAATAGTVPATKDVIDNARIGNPYGPDQVDLANAVADALRAHPVLRHRAIRPVVENTGRLALVGQVRQEAEKREALDLIAALPGVHSVREELEVVP